MRVKFASLLTVVALAASLSGCATTANYARAVNSWHGADASKLITVWGYPDRIRRLPNGHQLYIYKTDQHGRNPVIMTPGYTTVQNQAGMTTVTSIPPTISGGGYYDLHCKTWFEINRRSRVVRSRFRGNNCVGTDDFAKQFSR